MKLAGVELRPLPWIIPAVAVTMLLLGVGWGLPSAERIEILCHDMKLSAPLPDLLDRSVETFFSQRETADRRATTELLRGAMPAPYQSPPPSRILTEDEKLAIFRRYLLGSSSVDERQAFVSLSRMHPARLDLDPRGCPYGGAFLYPLGAAIFLLNAASVLHLKADPAHYLTAPADIRGMFVVGRLLSIAAFAGVLWVLGDLGRRMGRPRAGGVAMAAWALSSLPLNQALVTKPHVWAAFWVLLSVSFSLRHRDEGRTRDALLGALSLGIAVASSLAAAFMIPGCLLVLARSPAAHRGRSPVPLAALLVLGVFFLFNPYLLYRPSHYLVTSWHYISGSEYSFGSPSLRKGIVFFRDLLFRSYAVPASLLGILTAVVLIARGGFFWRRIGGTWLAAAVVLAFTTGETRYALFLGPVLCLFAGIGADDLLQRPSWRRGIARTTAIAALLVPGACVAGLFALDTLESDAWIAPTRAWIREASIGAGTTIGLLGDPEPQNVPALPFLACNVVNLNAPDAADLRPDYVVIGNDPQERAEWEALPQRSQYRLALAIGDLRSRRWLAFLRLRNESHVAAWVYVPTEGTGGAAEPPRVLPGRSDRRP